jgi:hypothetical protein
MRASFKSKIIRKRSSMYRSRPYTQPRARQSVQFVARNRFATLTVPELRQLIWHAQQIWPYTDRATKIGLSRAIAGFHRLLRLRQLLRPRRALAPERPSIGVLPAAPRIPYPLRPSGLKIHGSQMFDESITERGTTERTTSRKSDVTPHEQHQASREKPH